MFTTHVISDILLFVLNLDTLSGDEQLFLWLQEMVIDEVNCQRYPRYLVYDIIKFEGLEVGQTEFPTRLTCIQKEIVGARNTYITSVKSR